MGRVILSAAIGGVVAALVVVVLQKWITGEINPAITGGVVGGVCASLAASRNRRMKDSE